MRRTFSWIPVALALASLGSGVAAEDALSGRPSDDYYDAFRQLEEVWPTPSSTRLASGAPGPGYWQQRADYTIRAVLDERSDTLRGAARITYYNRSPHTLTYIWVHLDQNAFAKDSPAQRSASYGSVEKLSYRGARILLGRAAFDGGMKIDAVQDASGTNLSHATVGTQMRIDLPQPLAAGGELEFSIAWQMKITPLPAVDIRAGVQQLVGDARKIYNISQWYPRLTAYSDVRGWHIKQFLGTGEFTLEFGDYDVEITVPADHTVAATGELVNAVEVLGEQRTALLRTALTSDKRRECGRRHQDLAISCSKCS